MEPRIQYAKTNDGVTIGFATAGVGPCLVYMPIFPFNHIQLEWEHPPRRHWYERLASKRMLARYDFRGTGLSQRNIADYSLDTHVSDLEAVVDRLQLEKLAIYGFLHTAPVAVAYAARHPERVSHLVLFRPYARGSDYASSPQGRAIRALIDLDWETYKHVATYVVTGWSEEAQFWSGMADESTDAESASEFIRAAEEYDVVSLLPSVKAPTLVLHRRQVRWPPQALVNELVSQMPNARLLMLEGKSGALNPGENMEASLGAIEEFLSEGTALPPAASDLPSGTAIILFADIVDSTALTERLGDAAFREKARDLDSALRGIIRDHAGSPIEGKLLGDGVLATFASARQAIEAALACGKAGNEGGLPLHVGLHAGDVIREDNNVYGGAVNIASRISGLSAPGEVLVSDVVRTLARTSAGVTFEDRGEQALKGVGEKVRVWVVRSE